MNFKDVTHCIMISITDVARFPVPNDNAVIALRDLSAGMQLQHGKVFITLKHDILTGHRFAAAPITEGDFITSWAYPFGKAVRAIEAGEYLCNDNVLFRLSIQEDPHFKQLKLPKEANFNDEIEPFVFDEASWQAPEPVERYSDEATFLGYNRGARGSGTRNHLVIINTAASTSPLVERLEAQFKDRAKTINNLDAIIGLRHTESASPDEEEQDRTLRTLAGLLWNPNVGGFIAIDSEDAEDLTNRELIDWMEANGMATDSIPFRLMTASDSFEDDMATASETTERMISTLSKHVRTPRPISDLRIGLQCGASDAFSGICGNVLSGAIGREIVRHGGIANLTETPELSGAEDYILSAIEQPSLGTRFIGMLDRFKKYLAWHGGKVDKNPSEGNLLGGLYNITLKSLGAAVKRDPAIPIQHIVEYGECMTDPGYYFMDGMGGDIASYTGQAAAGCNIVLFVTGRGSPTNSSIVPTIKIVNTTGRYKMMEGDIDINAGAYLEGTSMDDLTDDSLDHVIRIASGERTKGEKRNQNIDLLWRRKFFRTDPKAKAEDIPSRFDGRARDCAQPEAAELILKFNGRQTLDDIRPQERIGLIIPTVGCSLATAQQAATKLGESELVKSGRISRFAVLTNTEGCGVTTGSEVLNFLLSYADHPQVEACCFLSLGCEMVSPSFIKSTMRGEDIGFPEISKAAKKSPLDPDDFGWVGIQDSGGTEHALNDTVRWFEDKLSEKAIEPSTEGSGKEMSIGVMVSGPIADDALDSVIEYIRQVVASGGSIVIPQCSASLHTAKLFTNFPVEPSLAFAQKIEQAGLHIMQSITNNRVEQVTGLGAATDLIINFSEVRPITAHSLTPTLNITAADVRGDFDLHLDTGEQSQWSQQIADLASQVLSGTYRPRQNMLGHTGNQIPRGPRAHVI